MKADHKIHGGWGHHIEWFDKNQFKNWDGSQRTFTVYGHLPEIPEMGQTLIGEFEKSFIKFEFVKVDRQHDPDDMFFAEVKPIEQELKGRGND